MLDDNMLVDIEKIQKNKEKMEKERPASKGMKKEKRLAGKC